MAVDTGIYANLLRAPKSVADYDSEAQAMQGNALAMQMRRQQIEGNALSMRQGAEAQQRNALVRDAQRKAAEAAGGDELAYVRNMRLSGMPELMDPADKAEKSIGDRLKVKSENAGRDVETENKVVTMWRDMVGNAANPEQAAQMVAAMHADPRIANTPMARVPLDQAMQMLQQTPFDQWKQQFALGAAKFLEMNKPTYQQRDSGGRIDTLALPGMGGAPSVVGTTDKTQTPDNIASNARIAADAAAGRAQSASQFNQRLAYDKDKDAKTAATGGAGNITEGERNAGGYAARMTEATKLLDQFESKGRATYKTDALGGVPLVGRALQTSAMSADQQQYRQAQEDWVRAKLRKESGAAIGLDEMKNEIATYFPQPGDRPENIAQKRKAREVANKAMVQAAGRGAPKADAGQVPAPGAVLKFDAQGNPVQ